MDFAFYAADGGLCHAEPGQFGLDPHRAGISQNQPANVEIITDKSQITRPYGNLGLLRIRDLAPDRDTLKRGVEKARSYVAAKGADAMFLGQYNSAEDGAANPRVTLIVYAIKYVDDLDEADIKAMQDFEIEGALNASLGGL